MVDEMMTPEPFTRPVVQKPLLATRARPNAAYTAFETLVLGKSTGRDGEFRGRGWSLMVLVESIRWKEQLLGLMLRGAGYFASLRARAWSRESRVSKDSHQKIQKRA